MDDLISRQKLLNDVEELRQSPWFNDDNYFAIRKDALSCVVDLCIKKAPSAQKKGHWELAEDGWYCTACELYPPFNCDPEEKGIPYCPNCGADMRQKEDGYE